MNFFDEVYKLVGRIPVGRVATYGQIAALLGNPRGARTVGWAMRAAPREMNLPCHRVVRSDGRLAPGHAFGGEEIQRSVLESEGITFLADGRIDIARHQWDVDETG